MPDMSDKFAEDILTAFAVEPVHDKAVLDSYLRTYPQLTEKLLDLALELEVMEADAEDEPISHSQTTDAAWGLFLRSTAVALISIKGFTGEMAVELGIKRAAVIGLRDRKVQPESLPLGFLKRLSTALKSSPEAVIGYLSQPSTLPAGASFKSGQKPQALPKVSIEQLLVECGHTPEEASFILRSD